MDDDQLILPDDADLVDEGLAARVPLAAYGACSGRGNASLAAISQPSADEQRMVHYSDLSPAGWPTGQKPQFALMQRIREEPASILACTKLDTPNNPFDGKSRYPSQGGHLVRLLVRAIRNGEGIAAFAVLLGFVVTLQFLAGAYTSGFGAFPDEPADLVSSLMVRDFIAGSDFRHPWQFAQQYYLHYPKVFIGIWPPGFYGALGTWFLIVGASRVTAIMFIAIVAAATASVIYFAGKRLIGRWAGVLASVLFVASPLVQEASARVMTEHLSTLGMLVSTLCFARFVRTERIADGLAFGIVAAAAILTHGNAWTLSLVPGITLALTNRWYFLRRPGFWLLAVPVLVTCVPWYVFTRNMLKGFWIPGVSYRLQAVPGFAWDVYLGVGLPVLIFAAIGVWQTIVRIKPRTEVAPEWAALVGLAIATFILYCILPVPIDSRYMVALLPSVVLFATAGVDEIAHRLGARLSIGMARVGLVLTLIVVFSLGTFALPLQLRNGGYEALARDVEMRVSHISQVWLVSDGATGEGSLVAAVALQEHRLGSYILLGKKVLAGGDMIGRNTEDRFDTQEKLAALLDEIPVTIIVIDDRIPQQNRYPYQDRMKKLLASEGDLWKLIGSYPQIQEGVVFPNSLHVYARRPVSALTLGPPAIRLDRVVALIGRDELREVEERP